MLLGLFLEAVSSLAMSLRLVDTSKLIGAGTVLQPSLPTIQLSDQFVGEAAPVSYSWALIAAMLVSLLVMVYLFKKKRFAMGDDSLWRLAGPILVLVIYVGFIELLSRIASLQAGNIQEELVSATAIVSFTAVVVVATVMGVLALLERSRAIHMSASLEGGSSVQGVRAVLESVRKRIYSMPAGEVYRDSVIACYSAMTGLLARYGAGDRPSFTPQELEASASRKLNLGELDIRLLTRLFEKARYADAPVTIREAQDSVDALERMTNDVSAKIRPMAESVGNT